jgi:hypothetical protein
MSDSAPLTSEAEIEDAPASDVADVPPGFQPPPKSRYRPSEAWALKWLGTPTR